MSPNTAEDLNGLDRGILNYFAQVQNYLYIEGNRKMIVYKDRKMPQRLKKHKGTWIVPEGWRRLTWITNNKLEKLYTKF